MARTLLWFDGAIAIRYDAFLLNLRHPAENLLRNQPDLRIPVGMSHRVQHLPHAGIAIHRFHHIDSRGADMRVAVVQQSFQHSIAHPHVLRHIGLQTLKSFQTHARIVVIAQRHHQHVADPGSLAAVSSAALVRQQF